ncbi:lipase family alpha/beta hydrolase [Burkholderia pseudomallei]|nr:alpha/beta fold hydrolase [Burkholderia pseudomallei]
MNTLERWPARSAQTPPPDSAFVFVHGILSSHDTFTAFCDSIYLDPRFACSDLYYFDYRYHDAMTQNGQSLANELQLHFGDGTRQVTLVCHSMGGLIARLAVMSAQLDFVKSIFLLGTPNLGALSTAQLGILAQLARKTAGIISGTFIRKSGITDLTRVYEILSGYRRSAGRASHIDYVSIPGCYFHEERPAYAYSITDVWADTFATMDNVFSIIRALAPLFSVSMSRPHDGIVEERSNCLAPTGAGRWSEKSATITYPNPPRRYYHVQLQRCEELTHTAVHGDAEVISLVKDICAAPDLQTWRASLPNTSLASMVITPP